MILSVIRYEPRDFAGRMRVFWNHDDEVDIVRSNGNGRQPAGQIGGEAGEGVDGAGGKARNLKEESGSLMRNWRELGKKARMKMPRKARVRCDERVIDGLD
jgi:hypothetical protein